MKRTIKTLAVLLIAAIPLFIFTSCSDDDDDSENYIPVTQDEIQGSWAMATSSIYYHVTFSNNTYSLDLMDIKTSDWVHRENGTYTLDDLYIRVDAEVTYDNTENYTRIAMADNKLYWESSYKNILHIWPLGSFQKLN